MKLRRRRRRRVRKIKGFGIKQTYVNKRNHLMLGRGKKQRGGFIAPLIPLLAPAIAEATNKLFG